MIEKPKRKLASIQRISSIDPIPNANVIKMAKVLGWEVVVKEGEFQPGELCVYCEIDSVMPERAEFEFLRKAKFRIRTTRMRGQISQGICFPLSVLPSGIEVVEGLDVTDVLGVTKFEPPIPTQLAGEVKGTFPSFLVKTDEIRIQTVPDVLIRHKGKKVYATEKLDGSSVTIYLRDGDFGVCSRNLDLIESDSNTLWKTARALDLEAKLSSLGKNVALQGELIGPGVQSNRYALAEHSIRFFNAFDINGYAFYSKTELAEVLSQLNLESVPFLSEFSLDHSVEELVAMSEAPSLLNPKTTREGIVVRPLVEERDDELGRFSFKVISPKFLLKGGN